MILTTLQIILLIIVFFALTRVFLRYREHNISNTAALFWMLIWILAAVGILLPATTTTLAHLAGVGRGADIVTYVSILLMFYLIFRIYVMMEGIRRDITSIIRQIALQTPKKGKNKIRKGKTA